MQGRYRAPCDCPPITQFRKGTWKAPDHPPGRGLPFLVPFFDRDPLLLGVNRTFQLPALEANPPPGGEGAIYFGRGARYVGNTKSDEGNVGWHGLFLRLMTALS